MSTPLSRTLRETLVSTVDEAQALDLLRRAIQTPSITGDELAFARLLVDELHAAGADEVHLEEVAPGRPIVWSVTRGTGGGRSLLLAGHLDTVRVDGWAERWRGSEREDPFGAAIVDGAVWGRGAGDLKGGIAAAIAAVRTVDRVAGRLDGDLITAWVCDEESGEAGLGRSIGMQALTRRMAQGTVPHADFAIYVEPTSLDVYPAQIGFLIADIALEGRSAYFGRPEEGVDALRAAHRVLSELWAHADEVSAREAHPLLGRPTLLVTEAAAGGYIAVPGSARLSVIRTLTPSEDLARAAAEIEAAVARGVDGTGVTAEVTFPAGRDHAVGGLPSEMPSDAEPIVALRECIAAVAPGSGDVGGAPFWSEASFLAARGIPCAYFAPGDIANCHTPEEHVVVREFLDAVRTLSLFIAGHCGGRPHPRSTTMKAHRVIAMVAAIVAAAVLAACGSDDDSDSSGDTGGGAPASAAATPSPAVGETTGPAGEQATPTGELKLTDKEIAQVKRRKPTAALVWHQSSDFVGAVSRGAKDQFAELGIDVVAETQANFDAGKQKSDIETVMAKRPDALLSLPVDPTATASAYRGAVEAGAKLVLLSNVPAGFKPGKDYVTVVTDDLFEMGHQAADALASAIDGKGEIAYFFHDAEYYVTNQRDEAFKKTIEENYPDIEIVAEQGIADPAKAEEQANGVLVKNPGLDGIYVTFSQPPAEGVLSALRSNGNADAKLVSLDLDEPLAIDMARGGNTAALVADRAYELGQSMAKAAAYGILGKEAPEFLVAPVVTVKKDNLEAGYQESLNEGPPQAVLDAVD